MTLTQIDFSILNWIQKKLQCAFCDVFWRIITITGNAGLFWLIIIAIFLIIKKFRKIGIIMFCTFAGCFITYHFILKGIIARPRPYQQNPAIKILISEPSGSSFPSGHAASAFCMSTLLFFFRKINVIAKKIWIPCVILATLISFSRLYLYVHFPSDVLMGIIYGFFCGKLGFFVYKKNNGEQWGQP